MKYTVFLLLCFSIQLESQEIGDYWIAKIDSLVNNSIDSMAFPGAQLYIGTKDSTMLNKSYGHHTYGEKVPVQNHHLYDLASLTKVTSGLLLLMKMVDAGLVDLDAPISQYLPSWKKSNKANLSLKQILSHRAGLQPYIVFWAQTLKANGEFKRNTFRSKRSRRYPHAITDKLFQHRSYHKKMKKAITKSPLLSAEASHYKYSGLLFLLLPDMIESILKSPFEDQLQVNFFDKLGMSRTTYNPRVKYKLSEIAPTEHDTLFRKTVVHGNVHDEAAAMLQGVSCNAGLFSNASDIAALFTMFSNKGMHKGKRILSASVIDTFTTRHYEEDDNRRGLGFDKPLIEYDANAAYISHKASHESFGHSGFTGTFVWVDPANDLIIVLLTNRVYPYRSQRNLYKMNIRPQLHTLCYNWVSDLAKP